MSGAKQFCLVACILASAGQSFAQELFTLPGFQSASVAVDPADLPQMLHNLCPGQEFIANESGCRVCPKETSQRATRLGFTVTSVLSGHFLKADSDDVLLQTRGCEPH